MSTFASVVSIANTFTSVFWILVVIAAAAIIAFLVYEAVKNGITLGASIKKAWNNMLDIFGPSEVVIPKAVQDFINEPANQSYTPWTPTVEPDESYPPAWLRK